MGVFLRGTRDSVLLVALLHSVFNRANNDNGISADLLDGDGRRLAVLLAAVVLTGLAALVVRRRLGRAERVALDAVHPVGGPRQRGDGRVARPPALEVLCIAVLGKGVACTSPRTSSPPRRRRSC